MRSDWSPRSGGNTVGAIADSYACSLEQTGDSLYMLLENPAPLHCSRLLCLLFRLQCFGHQTRQDLQGGRKTKRRRSSLQHLVFPSLSALSCTPFFFFFFFVPLSDFCAFCRLLSHTGQLSSLYRACVIFCTHVCPSDHCDRQCVSYALNKNESRKKEMSLCSRNAPRSHQ